MLAVGDISPTLYLPQFSLTAFCFARALHEDNDILADSLTHNSLL